MKKNITFCFLLALVCLGLQSCLFQEDNYFEDSSANRATEDVRKYNELLLSAPNGWRMEYYIGEDYALGGITLLCKFDGKQVKMASQGYEGSETISSLYKVVSEVTTMLTFDTYNEYIHAYGKPLGGGSNPNGNLQGDYEFIIKEAVGDTIVMQGKKYGNTILLIALPAEATWDGYINAINKVDDEASFKQYDLLINGQSVGLVQRSNYTLSVSYSNGGVGDLEQVPFLFTVDGLRFRTPILMGGLTVQNFVWDLRTETFTCKDPGVTGVQLKGIYPEGYIKYGDYLGEYILKCERYQAGGSTQVEIPVSIVEDVYGKSYKLKGLIADLSFTYDKVDGVMSFKTQRVGLVSGYYLSATTSNAAWGSFYPSYVSYQLGLLFGLMTKVEQQSPFTFTLVDDGSFSQNTGKGDADNLIFDRYTSPECSESSFVQGIAVIYEYMSFSKVEE